MVNGKGEWQRWLIGGLLGLVAFLVGAGAGSWTAYAEIQGVKGEVAQNLTSVEARMDKHIGLPAHPVTEVQYGYILEQLTEIKADIKEIRREIASVTD